MKFDLRGFERFVSYLLVRLLVLAVLVISVTKFIEVQGSSASALSWGCLFMLAVAVLSLAESRDRR